MALIAEQGASLDPAECDPAGVCNIILAEAPEVRSPTGLRRGRSDAVLLGPRQHPEDGRLYQGSGVRRHPLRLPAWARGA